MTRKIYFLAAAAAAASSLPAPAAEPIDKRTKARIDRILKRTPLIDGHNDIAGPLAEYRAGSVAKLDAGTDRWAPIR